jgi:hypothetical protein
VISFGFGTGDILKIYDRAKAIINAYCDGLQEFKELSREVETLQIMITQVLKEEKNPESLLNCKGIAQKKGLK